MKTKKIIILASILSSLFQARAEEIYDVKSEEVLASVRTIDIYKFQGVSDQFHSSRKEFVVNLIDILNDPKSSNFSQCAAAYYLGELYSVKAVGILNSNIVLQLDASRIQMKYLVKIDDSLKIPAVEALVKIGNPSIPAVIRNLADSDDAKVRELSLQVLTRIDGDKDISQLRLQKALKAETDLQKQARLQSALKELEK